MKEWNFIDHCLANMPSVQSEVEIRLEYGEIKQAITEAVTWRIFSTNEQIPYYKAIAWRDVQQKKERETNILLEDNREGSGESS